MVGRIFYQVLGGLLQWLLAGILELCSSFCFQCPSGASDHLTLSDECQEKGSLGSRCVKGDGHLFF